MSTRNVLKQILPPVLFSFYKKIAKHNTKSEKELFYDYQKIIHEREKYKLQDVNLLSEDIPGFYLNSFGIDGDEANFYGGFHALTKYAHRDFAIFPPLNISIQHGYVFEIKAWEKSKLERINLVWSKRMVDLYQEHTENNQIYAIGAPFFYADSILSEKEIAAERKRLGRNLLAFPMHSSHNVDTNFDPSKFLDILKAESAKFDSIRICLYWKDILRGEANAFLNSGYECVCCGHIFDPNFLRRQKALFEVCDATISNGVGSHIGYSVFMQKPHNLIADDFEYVNNGRNGDAADLTDVMTSDNFKKVEKAFLNNNNYVITEEQMIVINEFWGIEDMKTPEEMQKLLTILYDY